MLFHDMFNKIKRIFPSNLTSKRNDISLGTGTRTIQLRLDQGKTPAIKKGLCIVFTDKTCLAPIMSLLHHQVLLMINASPPLVLQKAFNFVVTILKLASSSPPLQPLSQSPQI